ncbi:MAG: thioredoxin [Christensenellales bacterium]
MKKLKMFHFEACPYCRETMGWLEEVRREHPELAQIAVEKIDERLEPEKIAGYDYWYVPTFFLDDIKVHEGVCSKQIVERVLRSALG